MKQLIIILFLLFSINSFSQTLTEKWNSYYGRYKYFDSSGSMIGYKKYNSLYDRWDYYDLKATNNNSKSGYQIQQPQSSIDIEVVDNALSSRQNRYNYNVLKVKNKIITINNKLEYLVLKVMTDSPADLDYKFAEHLKYNFYTECVKNIESKKYDYSNSSLTNSILSYLENYSVILVKKELSFLKDDNIDYYNTLINKYISLN